MIEVKDFYKVSEIADFFGVSSDVIRFYDKMGILSPGKNRDNNYRTYTWSDLICMDYILRLKKIDLPLSSIKQIINDFTVEESLKLMKKQENEIDQKIEQLTYARKLAREHITLFEEMERKNGIIEIKESPTFICREIDGDQHGILEDFQRLTNSQMPCLTFRLTEDVYNLNDLPEDASYEEYKRSIIKPSKQYIGIIDNGLLSRSQLVRESQKLEIFHSKLCVHAMKKVKFGETLKFLWEIYDWREEHNYRARGDSLTRLLTLANGEETEFTYYDIWVPVEAKL